MLHEAVDDVGPFPLQEVAGAGDRDRADAIAERHLTAVDEVRTDDGVVWSVEHERGHVDELLHQGRLALGPPVATLVGRPRLP